MEKNSGENNHLQILQDEINQILSSLIGAGVINFVEKLLRSFVIPNGLLHHIDTSREEIRQMRNSNFIDIDGQKFDNLMQDISCYSLSINNRVSSILSIISTITFTFGALFLVMPSYTMIFICFSLITIIAGFIIDKGWVSIRDIKALNNLQSNDAKLIAKFSTLSKSSNCGSWKIIHDGLDLLPQVTLPSGRKIYINGSSVSSQDAILKHSAAAGLIFSKINRSDKTKININGYNITAIVYYNELAKSLVSKVKNLQFLVLTRTSINIDTESVANADLSDVKHELDGRIADYDRSVGFLNCLNKPMRDIGCQWSYVHDGIDKVFYTKIKNVDENQFIINEISTKCIARFGGNYTTHIEKNFMIVMLRNPDLNRNVKFDFRPKKSEPSTRIDSGQTWQTKSADDDVVRQKPKNPKAEESQTRDVPGPREQIERKFLKIGLSFSSIGYSEQHSIIRPMFAAWLPDYCHFSYLDRQLSQFLPNDLDLNSVISILLAGNVFPSGKIKSKQGHTGIVQANEVYQHIHNKHFISDYKIKCGKYRLHGRFLEMGADGRSKLFIFDGIRKGH